MTPPERITLALLQYDTLAEWACHTVARHVGITAYPVCLQDTSTETVWQAEDHSGWLAVTVDRNARCQCIQIEWSLDERYWAEAGSPRELLATVDRIIATWPRQSQDTNHQ